ncbi:MAG: TRIC cation channel family protein [Gordonia sp. (in: high G+C Gram-positive bacteria)]
MNDAAGAVQYVGELAGVFAFAASGALAAVRRNLDITGILLLAVATALGGGVIRDLIIGNTPPAAFIHMEYLGTAVAAGVLVSVWQMPARLSRWPLDITDAVGLGLFAVTGTLVAHQSGLNAPGSALLGMTTAIGGGVIRDVLTRQVPSVLRPGEYLYAIPALLCAIVATMLVRYVDYQPWMGLACAAIATVIRLASLRFGWHGPEPWYRSRTTAEPVDQ